LKEKFIALHAMELKRHLAQRATNATLVKVKVLRETLYLGESQNVIPARVMASL
jgi:hypothetical protein